MLKGANLSEQKQQLARATCSEWNYKTLKLQLKKIFDESTSTVGASYLEGASGGFSEMQIKSEPSNFTQSCQDEESFYGRGGRNNPRRSYNEGRNYNEGRSYNDGRSYNEGRNYNEGRSYNDGRNNNDKREELNPIVNGNRLKCIACKSIYHLIKDCAHRNSYNRSQSNQNWRNPQGTYLAEEEPDEYVHVQLFTSSQWKRAGPITQRSVDRFLSATMFYLHGAV